MTAKAFVVQCSCPDEATARQIARSLVEERLVACAQLLPVASLFRWNGSVQEGSEVLLLLKTSEDRWPALEARLRRLHPYEVPEIIALPVLAGSADYLAWIATETSNDPA